MLLLPELSIFFFSIVCLFFSVSKNKTGVVTFARLWPLCVLILTAFCITGKGELFSGAYRVDLFSQTLKLLMSLGLCLVILMLDRNKEIEEAYLPEYYMFFGFSILGLMMLASSVELISIVISLEISSYSLYAIVPLRKGQTRVQIEASMKYLFFGAISTGIMIFGMSYLYGMTHSTFLADIVAAFPEFINKPIGVLALILTLSGFFFKLSLFPFHFWAPDIYEGASNNTTTFIATIPKIAATALLIRIGMLALPVGSTQIVTIMMVLAALSMTVGNLVGLVQKDIKRLLAYSGIAHAGYLMLGILSLSKEGNASALFYITIYVFMNLACFYVIILMSRKGENVTVNDLAGLSRRSPILALLLAVAAFSLAGIPPTGGFTGKLFLLTSAFRSGHLAIVIIGAVNTVISIFYYLNLVRMSYSKEAAVSIEPIKLSLPEKVLCYLFIFIILYMGILPFGLLELFKVAV
jgi:NADH-quinone oxidoreductase subunit N